MLRQNVFDILSMLVAVCDSFVLLEYAATLSVADQSEDTNPYIYGDYYDNAGNLFQYGDNTAELDTQIENYFLLEYHNL